MNPANFYTRDVVAPAYRDKIGEHTYGDPRIVDFGEGSTLIIGKYCSIASGVVILLGGNHRTDWVTTYPFPALGIRWTEAATIEGHPQSRGDVVIGNDVWLGTDAMILSGVRIGDGAVVAARSVVTRDVPPYGIVAGNPAKLVRTRFDNVRVQALLALRWWDWPDDEVARHLTLLCSPDIDRLLKAFVPESAALPEGATVGERPRGPIRRALARLFVVDGK
ncbi:MAG: CatB-related O-acetyltransferase [Desulfuromonadales bacterium]|nr:CatB-related O-acetyltransferase [Desulfuromonadales bacterium]